MTTPFTILEHNILKSIEFKSLTPCARLEFIDLLVVGKRANRMGEFKADESKPFRFHPHMANTPAREADFYRHIRTFEALGLIEIIRARRPGLPQFLVLNGQYAKLIKDPLYQCVCPEHSSGRARNIPPASLKDRTRQHSNVNVAFDILRSSTPKRQSEQADVSRAAHGDPELDKDLLAIAGRIEGLAGAAAMNEHTKLQMAYTLKKRAYNAYRLRDMDKRSKRLDVHRALDKMLQWVPRTSPAPSENWTPPARKVQDRFVQHIMEQTGDKKSQANWWLLVSRMSQTAKGFNGLERIVYDFLDVLARKDPRATPPDSPGAVLNGLLRAECGRQGINLAPTATASPQATGDRPT